MVFPNTQVRDNEGAEGTYKGHENAEGMGLVGVRLTVMLGNAHAEFDEWCQLGM